MKKLIKINQLVYIIPHEQLLFFVLMLNHNLLLSLERLLYLTKFPNAIGHLGKLGILAAGN
jgi:hypothetical protein